MQQVFIFTIVPVSFSFLDNSGTLLQILHKSLLISFDMYDLLILMQIFMYVCVYVYMG